MSLSDQDDRDRHELHIVLKHDGYALIEEYKHHRAMNPTKRELIHDITLEPIVTLYNQLVGLDSLLYNDELDKLGFHPITGTNTPLSKPEYPIVLATHTRP